jgi:predicted MFS family arabinose efflux permease
MVAVALHPVESPSGNAERLRSIIVVIVSATILFVNNGWIIVGPSAFDSQLLAEFGSGVGALKLRDMSTFMTVAVMAPFAGMLLDRVGVRPLMIAGMLLMATGLAAYRIADSLPFVYGIHILFGLCLVTSGLFANVILVAAFTHRHRGLAIGIIIAGSSLGQALSPRINTAIGHAIGWRDALLSVSILPLLTIPLILLFIPRINWHQAGPGREAGEGLSYAEALRHRNFWLLAIIAGVGFCTQLGVVSNVLLFVQRSLGGTAETGGSAVFVIFICAFCSQIGGGWLADRVGTRLVHVASLIIMASGFGMMALAGPDKMIWLWLGAMGFGLGWGGNYSLIQLLSSNLFLGPAIGRIIGTIAVIESFCAAVGPVMVGSLYDRTGTYAVPFTTCAILVALCIIASLLLTVPPRRGATT